MERYGVVDPAQSPSSKNFFRTITSLFLNVKHFAAQFIHCLWQEQKWRIIFVIIQPELMRFPLRHMESEELRTRNTDGWKLAAVNHRKVLQISHGKLKRFECDPAQMNLPVISKQTSLFCSFSVLHIETKRGRFSLMTSLALRTTCAK